MDKEEPLKLNITTLTELIVRACQDSDLTPAEQALALTHAMQGVIGPHAQKFHDCRKCNRPTSLGTAWCQKCLNEAEEHQRLTPPPRPPLPPRPYPKLPSPRRATNDYIGRDTVPLPAHLRNPKLGAP